MPTTEAGKAVSALNSIQHGMLAQTAAIPGVERLEDWQAHRQGLLDALAPQDDLELCLAERVALSQERVEEGVLESRRLRDSLRSPLGAPVASTCGLEQARELLEEAQRTYDLLQSFPSLPGDASLPYQDVSLIISAVDAVAQNVDAAGLSFPSLPDDDQWDLNP